MFESKSAGGELSGFRRLFDWLPSNGTFNLYAGGLMPGEMRVSVIIMNRQRQGDDNA
jgi:hypothetical protein